MIVPRAYCSPPAASYLVSLVFSLHSFLRLPLLPLHTPVLFPLSYSPPPPLHLNAFGSVVPPPYCVKVCFLTARRHLSPPFSPCLHSISRVYIFFFALARYTYLGHMRGPVTAVGNGRSDGCVVLAMSHKETGSAALSYRCSRQHRRPTEPSSALLLHATPILRGEETVSDSMTRSPTPVSASASSPAALPAARRGATAEIGAQPRGPQRFGRSADTS